MDTDIRRRIVQAMIFIGVVVLVGTLGFHSLLDAISPLKAFYLTVITLSTVGYGDLSPLNNAPPGANQAPILLFTILLLFFGIGSFLYTVTLITEYIISGQMGRSRQAARMQRHIARLQGHHILCGLGATGLSIARELTAIRRPFVAIDLDEKRLEAVAAELPGLRYLVGDATEDRVLREAGLERAAGVAAALPDEKDNLLITVSLAEFRSATGHPLRIVAKATHWERTGPKLELAGADAVIAPNTIAGRRLMSEISRASVTTFLDRMLGDEQATLRVAEVTLSISSSLVGRTLATSLIREQTGLLVLARQPAGTREFESVPTADTALQAGDSLITAGPIESIVALRHLAETLE